MPRTLLGELTALPRPHSWRGWGLAALSPRAPHPLSALRTSGFGPSSPFPRDKIPPPKKREND